MGEKRLVIIGGGPAGLLAGLMARACGVETVTIIDRNNCPGGILPQCIHTGFGTRDFSGALTGPEYAEALSKAARQAGVELVNGEAVIEITEDRHVYTAGASGVNVWRADAIIVATGCRERTVESLGIAGTRPAGIFPAGSAQKMINLGGYSIGERVVILGSGDVGLILARRLALEGVEIVAVLEKEEHCTGLRRNKLQCLDAFHLPFMPRTTVNKLYGERRLTGVRVCPVDADGQLQHDAGFDLDCDTLISSVGLIPETDLLDQMGIMGHNGAIHVNKGNQTSLPWLFLCGNARRVHSFVETVAEDGVLAGRHAAKFLLQGTYTDAPAISLNDIMERLAVAETVDAMMPAEDKQYLTGTVSATYGKRLPVKTSRPVPLIYAAAIMAVLKNIRITAPMQMGQVVVADVAGTGADILATSSLSGEP